MTQHKSDALDAHELECARAAIAARLEKVMTTTEKREWRKFLRELEGTR